MTERALEISRIFSLGSSLFSSLCYENSRCLVSLDSQHCGFNSGSHWACPGSPSSCAVAWKCSPDTKLGQSERSLCLSPICQGSLPSLSYAPWLKPWCFIYCAPITVISGGRVNPVTATPLWAEVEMLESQQLKLCLILKRMVSSFKNMQADRDGCL